MLKILSFLYLDLAKELLLKINNRKSLCDSHVIDMSFLIPYVRKYNIL